MFKTNLFNRSKLFEKLFNRENGDEKDIEDIFKGICENCNIEKPQLDRVVGKPVKADNRTIYPIIDILAIGNKMQNFKGVEIFPVAVVVEEAGEKYAISLTGEEIDSDELIGWYQKNRK